MFSWNPCNPFSYPKGKTTSTCGNVAVCMQISIASLDVMISLGKQNSAMFTKDEGGMHLSYVSTQGGHVYVANIILRCNQTLQNSVFDVDTYSPPYLTNTTSIYSSILNSKYACSSLPMTKTSPSTSTKTTITSKRPSDSTISTRTLVHTTNTQSRNAATSPIKHVYNLVLHCLAMLITLS